MKQSDSVELPGKSHAFIRRQIFLLSLDGAKDQVLMKFLPSKPLVIAVWSACHKSCLRFKCRLSMDAHQICPNIALAKTPWFSCTRKGPSKGNQLASRCRVALLCFVLLLKPVTWSGQLQTMLWAVGYNKRALGGLTPVPVEREMAGLYGR